MPVPTAGALRALADDSLWRAGVIEVCQRALAGEYSYFSHHAGHVGWPPQFNRDPFHDIDWPVGKHWLDTARSGPPRDDIKLVWEPSRLSLAFLLGRAYVRDRDETWARAFWQMFNAWVAQNPPQLTVAWGCGQEIALRLMAVLFGAITTLESSSVTPERLFNVSRFAWQAARQIETNINYARSQKNNHALSEAAALLTVGLLFPEFPRAQNWRKAGRDILSAEIQRQIYADGSYVQHSLNYHRVMVDDMLWSIRLGQINDYPLPQKTIDRFARSIDWLIEMIDPGSGRAPNYGPNDGALVLPLSCCDYLDYRPIANAATAVLNRSIPFPAGPWDEKQLWLCGRLVDPPKHPRARRQGFSAKDGGYHVLRGPGSWCMTRCHSYRDRPNQCDMLHVDLWQGGENILRDGGSYIYYCEQPWKSYFYSTAAHNVVQIDDQEQMLKGPRFLWFKWIKAKVLSRRTCPVGRVDWFLGQHEGFSRLPGSPLVRRGICRIDDSYVIVDDLLGKSSHKVAIRWRMAPGKWDDGRRCWEAALGQQVVPICLYVPESMTIEVAAGLDEPAPEGWESLYYQDRQAAATMVAKGPIQLPARFVTIVQAARFAADQGIRLLEPPRPDAAVRLAGVDESLVENVRETTGGEITVG